MLFPLASIFSLDYIQAQIATYGYPVLFGLLFACGLGLMLPEDIPLLFAGYFVADGKMNLLGAAVCAWCGIIGGDCILYYLGYRFGLNITRVPVIGTHINHARIKWAHEKFEKYGVWVVAIGRLFAGVRGAMVITAGTIRFTFSHFLIADGLAAIVSGGIFLGLGYWGRLHFGDMHHLEARIEHYKLLVTTGLAVIALVFFTWQWLKKKKSDKRKQLLIQKARLREAASGKTQ